MSRKCDDLLFTYCQSEMSEMEKKKHKILEQQMKRREEQERKRMKAEIEKARKREEKR